jgi:hypothetical protein
VSSNAGVKNDLPITMKERLSITESSHLPLNPVLSSNEELQDNESDQLRRYRTLLRLHVPPPEVKDRMIDDGINEEEINKFISLHVPGSLQQTPSNNQSNLLSPIMSIPSSTTKKSRNIPIPITDRNSSVSVVSDASVDSVIDNLQTPHKSISIPRPRPVSTMVTMTNSPRSSPRPELGNRLSSNFNEESSGNQDLHLSRLSEKNAKFYAAVVKVNLS